MSRAVWALVFVAGGEWPAWPLSWTSCIVLSYTSPWAEQSIILYPGFKHESSISLYISGCDCPTENWLRDKFELAMSQNYTMYYVSQVWGWCWYSSSSALTECRLWWTDFIWYFISVCIPLRVSFHSHNRCFLVLIVLSEETTKAIIYLTTILNKVSQLRSS